MTQEEIIKDCDRAIALMGKIKAEVSGKKKVSYIDLGLPSGTLWAETNEEGFYTFDKAIEKFGKSLPDVAQFTELRKFCNWEWDDEKEGFEVTGINGNSIFLPAEGFRCNSSFYYVGTEGRYWSNTAKDSADAYYLSFCSDYVKPSNYNSRYYGRSVRLVKSTK